MRILALTSWLCAGSVASAQTLPPYVPLGPSDAWRTVETPHFVVHYPATFDAWTRAAAARLEAQRDAERRLIGWVPSERITVLVADPYNDANGSAYPFLHAPAVFLWPVPPTPREETGNGRAWSELLTVHELAHVAHLARPSRNPMRRTLAALLPTNIGPIGGKTPRWVWEGYATYVEGKLSGSGRPYGVWRPAFLREWALEGRLPSYAAVSDAGGFAAGSFAYLAGSAYFEWLVAQRGDSSLPALWRRMTARTPRSFDVAFAGVFPGTPAELYARWTAQVTGEAIAMERRLRDAGLVEGTLVQRLRGATGDPAVSPDGERVALVVRPAGRSSRIVVWRTGAEPRDSARDAAAVRMRTRARERARRLDPEDVPAVPYLPAPKRTVATLLARDGRSFRAPRWEPDGMHVLVERDEPLADGSFRPDLWQWDTRDGSLRRLTHAAAVRDADPSPDGASAIATQCVQGWCDVVGVDLASGAVRTLVAGSPESTYVRPRWSHDGRRYVLTRQQRGRWELAVGDVASPGLLRRVGPDDGAARYDASFLAGDSALVVTSEASGVPNVERIDLRTGRATTLTRVTGAAFAPEPIGAAGAIYMLALRSTGYDLRSVELRDSVASQRIVSLAADTSATLARVASGAGADAAASAVLRRSAPPADTFATSALDPSRSYGLGPRHYSLLPAVALTPDGNSVLGVLTSADPAGRLVAVLIGAGGAPATWRGGALSAALRVLPVAVEGQLFDAAQRVGTIADARYAGGVVALSRRASFSGGSLSGRLGASAGELDADVRAPRSLAFLDAGGSLTRGRGDVVGAVTVRVSGSTGTSAHRHFDRATLAADAAFGAPLFAARGSYVRGTLSGGSGFERFAVGGAESPLIDASVLGQRIAMPALATGALAGRRVEVARVAIGRSLLEPFAWAARAPDQSSTWRRVIGAQASWVTGAIPFARAPGVRASAGVAEPLDGPTRHRAQLYLSIAPRP